MAQQQQPMDVNSTVDIRVRYLEQVTQQLNQQVKVMKQLVSTEVSDLKAVMQQQVAEIKQIVMHQDRIYQERIRRLESRVEQLSEFSMQLARSTGTAGQVQHIPLDFLSSSSHADASFGGAGHGAAAKGLSPPRGGGGGGGFDDEEEDIYSGIQGVILKNKEKLGAIYDFYTHSNIQVFHPAMTIAHFTKLCKDCDLSNFKHGGEPAELLWMAVMRQLGKRKVRPHIAQPKHHTSINSGKFPKTSKTQNFAFERMNEIPKEHFGEAMAVLGKECLGKARPDLPVEHLFETFLLTEIFPRVDMRIEAARSISANAIGYTPGLSDDVGALAANSLSEYKTEEVKQIIREYMTRIKEAFNSAIKNAQHYTDRTMNLDGFVEFVRAGDLMSSISKPDVRHIFLACAAIEASHNAEAKPDNISLSSLLVAVRHLADRIYGNRLFVDKYPTPESRVQKLLSKMFLLRE